MDVWHLFLKQDTQSMSKICNNDEGPPSALFCCGRRPFVVTSGRSSLRRLRARRRWSSSRCRDGRRGCRLWGLTPAGSRRSSGSNCRRWWQRAGWFCRRGCGRRGRSGWASAPRTTRSDNPAGSGRSLRCRARRRSILDGCFRLFPFLPEPRCRCNRRGRAFRCGSRRCRRRFFHEWRGLLRACCRPRRNTRQGFFCRSWRSCRARLFPRRWRLRARGLCSASRRRTPISTRRRQRRR